MYIKTCFCINFYIKFKLLLVDHYADKITQAENNNFTKYAFPAVLSLLYTLL